MLPVNYLVAADHLLERKLFAPSGAASYTAAYHALHAFLALRGRVICDLFQWIAPPSSPALAAIAGVLTKNNRWLFEPRERSHRAKWLEVRDALAPGEVPPAFEYLFGHVFPNRRRKGTPILEAIRDPHGTLARIDECWEDLLLAIAETRHRALYSSFGEDPYVVEALWNGDTSSSRGIDRQAKALLSFAALLLNDEAARLAKMLATVTVPPSIHGWMSATFRIPWFDEPHTSDLPFDTIGLSIRVIEAWLEPNTAAERRGA
jgi:hypothetical protein